MPHFFFDTLSETEFFRDTTGIYFSRLSEAIMEAKRTLGEMARDAVPRMDGGAMTVWVRDHGDHVLFAASLRLDLGVPQLEAAGAGAQPPSAAPDPAAAAPDADSSDRTLQTH